MAPACSSAPSSLLGPWLSAAAGVASALAGVSSTARAQTTEGPTTSAAAPALSSQTPAPGPQSRVQREAASSTSRPAAAAAAAAGGAEDDAARRREERLRAAEVEARAKALSRSIRCLECASHQSIEDSHTDIATLMRRMIRDDLRRGMQEKDILEKLRADYGDGVLYSPPMDFVGGAALWLLPAACIAGFLGVTWMQRRPPGRPPQVASNAAGVAAAGAGFVRPRHRRGRR